MSLHAKDPRTKSGKRLERGTPCQAWAMLLLDAADDLLTEAEQTALDQHLAGCAACSEEVAEAQRGLAWLSVLKDQSVEPPTHLLANILTQTTGMEEAGVTLPPLTFLPADLHDQGTMPAPSAAEHAKATGGSWWTTGQNAWEQLLQPRLAMTSAMAFFSICLTLNLLGFSAHALEGQALRGGVLHRTVADTGASLVRSFQGIRTVYRVESRVSGLRAQMDGPGPSTENQ